MLFARIVHGTRTDSGFVGHASRGSAELPCFAELRALQNCAMCETVRRENAARSGCVLHTVFRLLAAVFYFEISALMRRVPRYLRAGGGHGVFFAARFSAHFGMQVDQSLK